MKEHVVIAACAKFSSNAAQPLLLLTIHTVTFPPFKSHRYYLFTVIYFIGTERLV